MILADQISMYFIVGKRVDTTLSYLREAQLDESPPGSEPFYGMDGSHLEAKKAAFG
jgi:hypothetical protein